MNKKLLSLLLSFLILGFISSFAQEDEGVEEQSFRNPSFIQGTTQSIFEDGQPINGSNWEWLHQTPQGNSLRWVKMWDASTWYAVGDGGTFMKTTDGAATWTVKIWINGGGSTNSNYDLYDAHFFDMNTGVAVGQNGKIVRTTDAGINWTILDPSGATGTFYDVFFVNATLGYACGSTSVDMWKTTDAGLTWTGPIVVPATAYSVYAVDEDTIYHGSTSGNFRRSTDAGATWTTINVGISSSLWGMNFTDPMNGWVSGTGNNPAYTTDGGLTWTVTAASPTASTQYDIDVMSTSTQTLNEGFEDVTFPPAGWHAKNFLGTKEWVRTTTQAHTGSASAFMDYESTGGEDWLITSQFPIVTGDSLVFWLRPRFTGWVPDSLIVKVSTTDTAIASFTNTILSIDVSVLTATWYRYAASLNSFAGQNIYIAFKHMNVDGCGIYLDDVAIGEPVLVDQVFITGDGFNIFSTTDMGTTWNPVDFLDPAQIWTSSYYSTDFMAEDNFVTTGYRGLINEVTPTPPEAGTVHTTYLKGGISFDVWVQGVTGRVISVGAATTSTSFDQGMYSTDGGETWAISTILDTIDRDFNKLSMVDTVTGYAAREDHYVSKTTDGGATWFPVTRAAVLTSDLETCSFVDENNGYVFGASGLGYKTTDGGTTWTTLTTTITGTIWGSHFVDAQNGYIVAASGNARKTTDGGTTFTSMTPNVGTTTIRSIYMVNSSVGYLSCSSGKVRKTVDAGVTWDTVDVGNTSPTLYEIEFANELSGITVGSSGRTFYTNDGGATWNYENTGMGTVYGLGLDHTSQDTSAAYVCGFSCYIMRNSHVVVPVELASLTASVNGNNVTINWTTATELNNFGFQVDRRVEGQSWAKVGFVNGHGTTTEPQTYTFTDAGLASGIYNYRIKQTDYDGSYKYYNLEYAVEVGVPVDFSLSQNYPNPFNPTTKITYSVPVDGFVSISIFNILGEKVSTLVNTNVKAGNYELTFDASGIASGMYLYRMESGDFISVKKMMILK